MAHYAFAYRADGQLEDVTLPNGAVNRYEFDGYGTLYRILADNGGLSIELGRSYFDEDLVLEKRRRLRCRHCCARSTTSAASLRSNRLKR